MAASEDDRNNASLYINTDSNNNNNAANDQAQSEADSDRIRKVHATNLIREFDDYSKKRLIQVPSNPSEYTNNPNVEFETISSGSNNYISSSVLGKRSAATIDVNSVKEEA